MGDLQRNELNPRGIHIHPGLYHEQHQSHPRSPHFQLEPTNTPLRRVSPNVYGNSRFKPL